MTAPVPGKRISENRRQQTRLIVAAATRCFCRSGFEATSIQMIADEARIPSSLLYRYFSDKRALMVEVADTFLSGIVRDMLKRNHLDSALLVPFAGGQAAYLSLYLDIRSTATRDAAVAEVFQRYSDERHRAFIWLIEKTAAGYSEAESERLAAMFECLFDGSCFSAALPASAA